MGTNFSGIDTLSQTLYNQQIVQNTIANNLSKTYRDSEGYVIASRERVDFADAPTTSIYNSNGYLSVGQGQDIQEITRLRSFYLDYQIQQQSMSLGKEEINTNALTQAQSILDGPSGTVSDQLTKLASDFSALSADPTNLTLRNAVVADGVSFAGMVRDQYSQLETLQQTLNQQVGGTVNDINGLLQQLNTTNQQLLASTANQPDSLLDARDYALDKLSRLVNFTASYGTKGTVSVSMNGLSLVNGSGAATLTASVINPHNPPLSDILYQSPEGTQYDITTQVQGGQLAGELQARDVTVEGYKNDLDHFATSVMYITNLLHSSGYGSDGVTTGINFFTGTSARDIDVNASIVTDSNRVLLAASSRYGDPANGQIAAFLGNLPNLVTDDRIESFSQMYSASGKIDPTQALNSVVTTGLNVTNSNSTNFSTIPLAAGSFVVNSATVNWNNGESIYQILDAINAADPTVDAVFNYAAQKIYMVSANAINIRNVTGNFAGTGFSQIKDQVSSMIRMNNGLTPQDLAINANTPLNSTNNTQAFKVTPSTSGSFQINVYTAAGTLTTLVNWNNTQSLNTILNNAKTLVNRLLTFNMIYNNNTQTVTIQDTVPISITDLTGNFTTFTGMNGSPQLGNMGSGLTAQVNNDLTAAKNISNQSQASLDQLNNTQADLSAVSYSGSSTTSSGTTTATESGEPADMEIAASVKSMIAYNAALQAMAIQEKMLSDLVAIVSGSNSGTTIQVGSST